jgi:uncharacterized membrane protein YdjX (TVP38/TMEM64 family)
MSRPTLFRLAALLALIVALIVIGRVTGLHERLNIEYLRATVPALGVWGVLVFIAAFCVGELIHVPGIVFVAVSVLVYGPFLGFGVGLLGAAISVSVSFWVVRAVGGKALTEIDKPIVRKMMAELDRRPVRAVAIMRLVLFLFPPLNYALALSSVRFRDYLIGSTLGLIPPILGCAIFIDLVLRFVTKH